MSQHHLTVMNCIFFCSASRNSLWGWMPTMNMASCCCAWIMLGIITGVIVFSLIPLYLPKRNVDTNYLAGMPYFRQFIFFFKQNSFLFRTGRHQCSLRHIVDQYQFINRHGFFCHSQHCKCCLTLTIFDSLLCVSVADERI